MRALATLAQEHAARATPVEQALTGALGHRYANPQPEDRGPLDLAYSNAMREVWKAYPKDPDAGSLFAEAMMDLRPMGPMDTRWEAVTWHGRDRCDARTSFET
jgi:hypothetical protein